mmetsp:Transcript_5730/g.13415  ORF Transcript_5730/g.13415 Transcript_5730/m.13415 type:complete len:218 (+) Transcript_5730:897-1550(+)
MLRQRAGEFDTVLANLSHTEEKANRTPSPVSALVVYTDPRALGNASTAMLFILSGSSHLSILFTTTCRRNSTKLSWTVSIQLVALSMPSLSDASTTTTTSSTKRRRLAWLFAYAFRHDPFTSMKVTRTSSSNLLLPYCILRVVVSNNPEFLFLGLASPFTSTSSREVFPTFLSPRTTMRYPLSYLSCNASLNSSASSLRRDVRTLCLTSNEDVLVSR